MMRLRSLPFLVAETDAGVVLKRGATEMLVRGDSALESVLLILASTADPGQTIDEISAQFAEINRSAVRQLLEGMIAKRLLVPAEDFPQDQDIAETPEEVFYWAAGVDRAGMLEKFAAGPVVIAGINNLSMQICSSLQASGIRDISAIDEPSLRNPDLFHENDRVRAHVVPKGVSLITEEQLAKTDMHPLCVVATSDVSGPGLLLSWNAWCVKRNIPFMPVFVRDMIGYAGPLVAPGETACLHCLRMRRNAHMTDARTREQIEEEMTRGHSITAVHPSMIQVVAATAVFELCHFFGRLPSPRPGRLITIQLGSGKTESNTVLKIPRCPVCSALNTKSSVQVRKLTPLPESDET